MMPNRRKFITNDPFTGFLLSIFTVGINSKSFPVLYIPYKKAPPKSLQRPSDAR